MPRDHLGKASRLLAAAGMFGASICGLIEITEDMRKLGLSEAELLADGAVIGASQAARRD